MAVRTIGCARGSDGDGTVDQTMTSFTNSSFGAAGTHDVELTVTDDEGANSSTVKAVAIKDETDPAPSARLAVTPDSDAAPNTRNESFEAANTGAQGIDTVTIDLSSAILPDLAFDPSGSAGDIGADWLTIDVEEFEADKAEDVEYHSATPDEHGEAAAPVIMKKSTDAGGLNCFLAVENAEAATMSSNVVVLEYVDFDPVDKAFTGVPTDPDGDETCEKINGDGSANVADAQALFASWGSDLLC